MFLIRYTATFFLLCFNLGLSAQNLQQEQKEMRRKYHNPYEQSEKTRNVKVFKLRGYTDSTQLIFFSGATCRMACIPIDESGVRKVLKEGVVNVSRSDIASAEKTFAVEYDQGGKVRVIVKPHGNALEVITVYPIDKKIDCDCKNN